jgi:hypothetical protein
MQYQIAFPDYPASTLPLIPTTWADVSYSNDTCPSFEAPNRLVVFIDYLDPQQREFGHLDAIERFSVIRYLEDGSIDELLHSNDWHDVLSYVASYGA